MWKKDFLYCYKLGSIYYSSNKTSINQEKAKKYLEKSCDNKIAEGCYLIGIIYQDEDDTKSKGYLEKACFNGYGFACYQLGNSYNEESVLSDKEYIKKIFKEACLNGFYPGCYRYLLSLF